MAFPPTIASFFPSTQTFVNNHFHTAESQYLSIEFFLIVVFTYFYTAVQFNPVDQADNLRKYGGYIPASVRAARRRSTSIACSLG
jgi:preprotein translocase subunit SecY